MNILGMLYSLIIKPLELVFDIIFSYVFEKTTVVGTSIIILSIVVNLLVLPLYNRADELQAEESEKKKSLNKWESHIKKHFKGDERFMMLQTYYRQNDYKPYQTLRGALPLLLEIPIFIAAYHYLSHIPMLEGFSYGPIADLSCEDGLLVISGFSINVLPILMTVINIISGTVYNRAVTFKDKLQSYIIALVFLVLLYKSPAGLVLYWTCNNIFSLIKNIVYRLMEKHGKKKEKPVVKGDKKRTLVFVGSALLFALLVGAYIPGTVYSSSPYEFYDNNTFANPVWYLVNSELVAIGLFFVWTGVYYYLLRDRGKTILAELSFIFCVIAFLNYATVPYDSEMTRYLTVSQPTEVTVSLVLQGVVIILAAFILCHMIYLKWKHAVGFVLLFAMLSLFAITSFTFVRLGNDYNRKTAEMEEQNNVPEIKLSKNGKNVVVIMMDRMVGYYVPYLMYERPELLETWDGFTLYPNCVSFGSATNAGSPGLYGGYEYRPSEINKRDTELLVDKQNEALKVMPVLFDENDYNVTVGDPTYAGYDWIPDLSIYDDYPDIYTYYLEGRFNQGYDYFTYDSIMNRNLMMFGLYRVSPIFMKKVIYDDGYYGSVTNTYSNGVGVCTFSSVSTSFGIGEAFLNSYNVLYSLPNISSITDDDSNNFNMFSNNTTHEANLLQMPDYTMDVFVNNTEYDGELNTKYSINGESINLFDVNFSFDRNDTIDDGTISKVICYHSDMAAMLRLGEWFDYLRANDVYDNTRIIIVSDHSCAMGLDENLFFKLTFKDGSEMNYDLLSMQSALLVKDFDSEGFKQDDTFMTNADVPTLATSDLITDPVNPFTGKKIDDSAKYNEPIEIMNVDSWRTEDNHGYKFSTSQWFSVHDNIFDGANWSYVGAY